MSMIESWTNIGVGIGLQMAANFALLPIIFGIDSRRAAGGVVVFAGVMTVLSLARGYGLRRLFEHLRTRGTPPDFEYVVAEIAAERHRQIAGERYTLAHDDLKTDGSLARGAAAYAFAASLSAACRREAIADVASKDVLELRRDRPIGNLAAMIRNMWPRWRPTTFKPTTPRRDLIKAAAMIVAEIGRLDRAQNAERNLNSAAHL
jgi:hypothetical protein